MLQCRHFPFCSEMPASTREHVEALRKAGNATTNLCGTKRRDFWSDSARCMGLVDTDAGVQFTPRVADTLSSEMSYNDLEVVASPSTNDIEVFPESIAVGLPRLNFVSPFESESITESREPITFEQLISGSTLVTLEDRDLVPDYVFLSLAQLAPCQLIADDRIGAYRARPIGFTGMCCRYCQGCQPGPGESTRVVYSAQGRNLNIYRCSVLCHFHLQVSGSSSPIPSGAWLRRPRLRLSSNISRVNACMSPDMSR